MKRPRGLLVGGVARGHSDFVVEETEDPAPLCHVLDQNAPATSSYPFEVSSSRHKMAALAKVLRAARASGLVIERLREMQQNRARYTAVTNIESN